MLDLVVFLFFICLYLIAIFNLIKHYNREAREFINEMIHRADLYD